MATAHNPVFERPCLGCIIKDDPALIERIINEQARLCRDLLNAAVDGEPDSNLDAVRQSSGILTDLLDAAGVESVPAVPGADVADFIHLILHWSQTLDWSFGTEDGLYYPVIHLVAGCDLVAVSEELVDLCHVVAWDHEDIPAVAYPEQPGKRVSWQPGLVRP